MTDKQITTMFTLFFNHWSDEKIIDVLTRVFDVMNIPIHPTMNDCKTSMPAQAEIIEFRVIRTGIMLDEYKNENNNE